MRMGRLRERRVRRGVVSFLVVAAALASPLRASPGETGARPVPSFRHEIVPLLTRLGCNQGACHGKQQGQNGFRLSLRGYAPELDHAWLTRQLWVRRIDRVAPEESLLLRKPLGRVPHEGGALFAAGSRAHDVLLRWLRAGAPGLDAEEPLLEEIVVEPRERVLQPGESEALRVAARFADGSVRDVTWLSVFRANDPSVFDVSEDGTVHCLRAGESCVRVHYQDRVAAVTITAPHERTIDPSAYPEPASFIDELVFAKLRALRIPPSPLVGDATFLRRAFLDTIGTLPNAEEARRFLDDASPDKRSRLVEDLLARREFVEFWALQLADVLQNRKERDHDVRGTKGVRSFHAWIRRQLLLERSWSEIARDVLTATGDSISAPQVGYYIVTVGEQRRPEDSEVAAAVAQSFLGTRIGCARCHNHPLEKYTQDDYYRFAAFFSRFALERRDPRDGATVLVAATHEERELERRVEKEEREAAELQQPAGAGDESAKRTLEEKTRQIAAMREEIAKLRARPVGVVQPRTGEFLPAGTLDRSLLQIPPGDDPRIALADWMAAPENDYFSGAMVNRVWKHFLGVGLVEPADDLRSSNPPSNVPLWRALVREFVASGHDLKHLIRAILRSKVYQLESRTLDENRQDDRFYSHHYARRLPAEVLLDAVSQVTGVPEAFPGYPLGMRAIQLPDPGIGSYFLSLFGRSERVTACACERSDDVTLPQLLHLQNGDWIQHKLRSPESAIGRLAASGSSAPELIETLFLSTLTRRPSPGELALVESALREAGEREEGCRDLVWALLNTKEFAFTH